MTLQEKQYLLAELQEIREEVKVCRGMLEEIKKDLPEPSSPRKSPNLHPSNMKLPRPTWIKAFIKEYGQSLYDHVRNNAVEWISSGVIPPSSLRRTYYRTHKGRKRPVGIKRTLDAHYQYLEYNGFKIKKSWKKLLR